MKIRPSLVIALLATCVMGAVSTGVVRAQTALPAFTIVEVEVIDPTGFEEFAKRNGAGVAAAGGRFIARRGRIAASAGTLPAGVSIIAWDSFDNATGYFDSPAFKALIPLRDKTARVRVFHVEGLAK